MNVLENLQSVMRKVLHFHKLLYPKPLALCHAHKVGAAGQLRNREIDLLTTFASAKSKFLHTISHQIEHLSAGNTIAAKCSRKHRYR